MLAGRNKGSICTFGDVTVGDGQGATTAQSARGQQDSPDPGRSAFGDVTVGDAGPTGLDGSLPAADAGAAAAGGLPTSALSADRIQEGIFLRKAAPMVFAGVPAPAAPCCWANVGVATLPGVDAFSGFCCAASAAAAASHWPDGWLCCGVPASAYAAGLTPAFAGVDASCCADVVGAGGCGGTGGGGGAGGGAAAGLPGGSSRSRLRSALGLADPAQ